MPRISTGQTRFTPSTSSCDTSGLSERDCAHADTLADPRKPCPFCPFCPFYRSLEYPEGHTPYASTGVSPARSRNPFKCRRLHVSFVDTHPREVWQIWLSNCPSCPVALSPRRPEGHVRNAYRSFLLPVAVSPASVKSCSDFVPLHTPEKVYELYSRIPAFSVSPASSPAGPVDRDNPMAAASALCRHNLRTCSLLCRPMTPLPPPEPCRSCRQNRPVYPASGRAARSGPPFRKLDPEAPSRLHIPSAQISLRSPKGLTNPWRITRAFGVPHPPMPPPVPLPRGPPAAPARHSSAPPGPSVGA